MLIAHFAASLAFLVPNAPLAPRTGTATRPQVAPARASAPLLQLATPPLRIGQFGFPEPGPPVLVEERDACGVGFIADIKGRRRHETIARAIHALSCMEHRGGCGGEYTGARGGEHARGGTSASGGAHGGRGRGGVEARAQRPDQV